MESQSAVISLSELTSLIAGVMDAAFGGRDFWVLAEVSNLKRYEQKQHYYFDLVEQAEAGGGTLRAKVSCVAWSLAARRIKTFEHSTGETFRDGLKILGLVTVDYHPVYGMKLQLHEIDEQYTLGNLEKQKRENISRLLAEFPERIYLDEDGELVTPNRLLKLPPVMQRIALITSPKSDGYRDFMDELHHNAYGLHFDVDEYPAQVQGENAAAQLLDALIRISADKQRYDAVVLVRGGGAQTDLLAFDQYDLAKAVALFPVPVITGIGHTRNESLADLVSACPVKTPTKAAAFLIELNLEFEAEILQLASAIGDQVSGLLESEQFRLQTIRSTVQQVPSKLTELSGNLRIRALELGMKTRLFLSAQREEIGENAALINRELRRRLHEEEFRQETVMNHLKHNLQRFISGQQQRMNLLQQQFTLLDPKHLLRKGYALLYHEGKVIRDAAQVSAGNQITARLHNGNLTAVVQSTETNEEGTEL